MDQYKQGNGPMRSVHGTRYALKLTTAAKGELGLFTRGEKLSIVAVLDILGNIIRTMRIT